MKELMMYSEGIRAAHDLGYVHPEVVGDNAPALQALTRGVSTSYQANLILQQTSHIHRTTRWVGTLDNLSDPFSRDTLIPSLPWNIQQHVPRSTLKGLGPGGLTYIASSERSKLGDSSFLLQSNPGLYLMNLDEPLPSCFTLQGTASYNSYKSFCDKIL